MPGGRPTKYTEAYAETARKLCEMGATDADLAAFFEVNALTISRWAQVHDEFCEALKVGKAKADDRVERRLYERANGYQHEAVKIFMHEGQPVYAPYVEHYPPDTTACIFWLKNRRRAEWRDKIDTELSGDASLTIQVVTGIPLAVERKG